jgi:hypothetical protein
MSDWEIHLALEFTKIAIFMAQLVMLGILVGRLSDVSDGLEEMRRAIVDFFDKGKP